MCILQKAPEESAGPFLDMMKAHIFFCRRLMALPFLPAEVIPRAYHAFVGECADPSLASLHGCGGHMIAQQDVVCGPLHHGQILCSCIQLMMLRDDTTSNFGQK